MPGSKASHQVRRQQILDAAYEVALDDGISGVTLRTVGARAGLSHGLVVFHFKEKDQLIETILDRVLAENDVRQAGGNARPPGPPAARMAQRLRDEMRGLTRDPRWLRLFLEYWALGVRDRRTRRKIDAALHRYRATFRLDAEPSGDGARLGPQPAADAFAAVAVSLVSGFALQATVGGERLDADAYARIVDAVVACVLGDAPVANVVRQGARRRSRA